MRWFFFLLLLTNLLLVGWLYKQTAAPKLEPVQAEIDTVPGQLRLLSELPQQSLQPIPPMANTLATVLPEINDALETEIIPSQSATVVEEITTEECVQFSPLAKKEDLEALTRKFEEANLKVIDSGEGVTERQTYWVIISPYKTDKAARDAATQLAKAKVRDFLVVRSGELENGISLGLFSQKEGAENRLREIQALKLNIRRPEVRFRTTSVRSHWLITRVSDDEAFTALQHQLGTEGIQSTPIACPP